MHLPNPRPYVWSKCGRDHVGLGSLGPSRSESIVKTCHRSIRYNRMRINKVMSDNISTAASNQNQTHDHDPQNGVDTKIRFANRVKLASANTTSGTYSTLNACSIAVQIRFAWRSDQNRKSSGSRAASDGHRSSASAASRVPPHDSGIRRGSLSKHSGMMSARHARIDTTSRHVGLLTWSLWSCRQDGEVNARPMISNCLTLTVDL